MATMPFSTSLPFSITASSRTAATIVICAATAAVSLYSAPAVLPEAMRAVFRALAEASAIVALAVALLAVLGTLAARWKRPPLIPALAVVAAWASFLLAPGTANASTLAGSSSTGSLLGLLGAALAFGIAVATPPIAPTPGAQTTEYTLAKYVTMFGMALTTIGTILATVSALLPAGSKPAIYVGVALAVIGALTKVATTLGYSSDRSDQKVEAIKAQGAVAAAAAGAQAAQNAGAGAEAAK